MEAQKTKFIHGRIAGGMVAAGLTLSVLIGYALHYLWPKQITEPQYIAICSILFICIFWGAYFCFASMCPCLRSFLRSNSLVRGENPYKEENHHSIDEQITKKSHSYITTVTLFMGITTFLLGSALQLNPSDNRDPFHTYMRDIILLVAVIDIFLFVFAVDMLDSALNPFIKSASDPNGLVPKRWFYRKAGATFPEGGGEHAFFGYAVFTVLTIQVVAYVSPVVAPFAVGAFIYLGYPFLFGYRFGHDTSGKIEVQIDEDKRATTPAVLLLVIFSAIGFFSFYLEHHANR